MSRPIRWDLALTFLLLAATLGASRVTSHRSAGHLLEPLETIDKNIAGFVGTDNPPIEASVLDKLKSDGYVSRTYRREGVQADLLIIYYAQQRAGESMHSPKHCLPGSGWEIWDYGSTDIPVGASRFTINKHSISNAGQRMLVLYWYQSRGRIIASEYAGKILLAQDALLQNSTAASIVRIIVPDRPDALDYARELASGLIPQLQQRFGG